MLFGSSVGYRDDYEVDLLAKAKIGMMVIYPEYLSSSCVRRHLNNRVWAFWFDDVGPTGSGHATDQHQTFRRSVLVPLSDEGSCAARLILIAMRSKKGIALEPDGFLAASNLLYVHQPDGPPADWLNSAYLGQGGKMV